MLLDMLLEESQKNLQLQKELNKKINSLPKGALKERKIKNNTYYYLTYRKKNKVIDKYIGTEKEEAQRLSELIKERKSYRKQLKELQKDWKIYKRVGIEEGSYELRQVITESAKGNDFSLSLRGFLDVFYENKNEKDKMYDLIKREPVQFENVPDHYYAICAAMANKLANDHDIKVPGWVWKDTYYMKKMYFGNIRKGRLRMYNMLYSPAEFKTRGLFVDDDILTRV